MRPIPVVFHVGPVQIHTYGIGLAITFLFSVWYLGKRFRDGGAPWRWAPNAAVWIIEGLFLNGQRLNPKTDGRPDSRPTVRENVKILGDLRNEFDFTQDSLPPLILNPHTGSSGVLLAVGFVRGEPSQDSR